MKINLEFTRFEIETFDSLLTNTYDNLQLLRLIYVTVARYLQKSHK